MIAIVLALVGWGVMVRIAYRVWRRGLADGDRPGDGRSRLLADGQSHRLVVTNPGSGPLTVGVALFARPHHTRWLDVLTLPTVRRPPRRAERRREDRGATTFLGVVTPGDEQRWSLDLPTGPTLIRVVVGHPDHRLRIHEHLADGTRPAFGPDAA